MSINSENKKHGVVSEEMKENFLNVYREYLNKVQNG